MTWPDAVVTAAADRATASAGRLSSLGAGAGALQLGFGLVVSAGLRRRHGQLGRLLVRRGASRTQTLIGTALPVLLSVAMGTALGLVAGAVAVAVRSTVPVGASPAAGAVRSAPEGPAPWIAAVGAAAPVVLLLGLAATGLSAAVLCWPERAARSTRIAVQTAGVAVLAAVPVLLATGSPLAGASVVLLLGLGTGLVAARLWSPLVGLGLRLTRPRPTGRAGVTRQAGLLAGRRRPLVAAVTTGFLAAACCSLVFATAYAASLARSAEDQAAFLVPLDVSVSASAQVPGPLDAVDPARLTAAGPGVVVHPVVSSTVTVFAGTPNATALPLTGLDPTVWAALHRAEDTTGSPLSPAALAARLAPGPDGADRTLASVPAGRGRLVVPVSGPTDDVIVRLWVATAAGRERSVDLTRRGSELVADLGPEAVTVRALEVLESASHLMHRQHGVGEGGSDRALAAGTLRFGPVRGGGDPLDWSWPGWGSDQAEVTADDSLSVRYEIADRRVVLTPGFTSPVDPPELPVVVDQQTASHLDPASTLGLTVNGVTTPARPVGVLDRMPGLDPAFVVADRGAVQRLLDRTAPGTAAVTQLWVTAPVPALPVVRAVLSSPPASAATVTFRNDVADALAQDPVSSRAEGLLLVAGGLALLLAWAGVAVAVRSEAEDAVADHLALELDGVTPSRLRRVLLARAASVVAVGVPLGIAGGVLATHVTLGLITGAPAGRPVVPPLHLVLGAPALGAAVLLAAVGTGLVAAATSRAAFRSPRPQAPEADLR